MNGSPDIEKTQHEGERKAETARSRARKPRRRRRRWLKVILGIVVFLLLVVGLAPTLLSTRAGTSLIVSFINKGIQGKAEIGDLSLSWFGPIELEKLRLLDSSEREVLKVNRLSVEIGVWRAIKDRERFQHATVESPSVVLYEQQDGSFSLLKALGPKSAQAEERPAKPELAKPKRRPEKPLPAPRGTVSLRNGNVRIVRHSGQELTVRELTGSFAFRSLNDIAGELRLALAQGGALNLEMTLRDIVRGGKFDSRGASGTMKVRAPEELDLGPIISLVSDKAQVAGRVNLSLDATLQSGKVTVQFDTGVRELSVGQAVNADVRPVSLNSTGRLDLQLGSLALKEISGDITLDGEGVQLATAGTYRKSQEPSALFFDDVLAAVLDGKSVELPDLSLKAKGQVDMARLGEAIPPLLKLREDLRLTSGKVLVDRLTVEGGAEPLAEGSLRLTDLSAVQTDPETKKEKTFEYKPITADFDASLIENEGLQIRSANLESDFATLHGQGSPKKMDVRLNADLGQFPDLSGQVEITAEVQRADSTVSFRANGSALGLSVKTKESQFSSDRLVFNSHGTYAEEQKKLSGEVALTGGESVATVTANAEKPEKLRVGSFQLDASVGRESPDAPIASAGKATITESLLNQEPLVEKTIALSWSDLKFSPKDMSLTAAEIKVDGEELLRLSATETNARFGDQPSVDGTFVLSTELSRLFASLQPLAKWEKPPAIAGAFFWNGRAATANSLISATGTATVDDLAVGSGEEVIHQGKVQLDHSAVVDLKNELLTLQELSLASQPLSLNLSGKVEKFKTDRILDLSGRYEGSWDRLMALLTELAPKLMEQTGLALSGTTQSELRITGPANQPKVQPVYRGIATNNIRLDWASGQLVGFELGQPAKLQPKFSDGQLILEGIAIPASGGSLNLSGIVDLSGKTATFRLPGKTQLIENVRITPDVGRMLLSRINPIFAQVATLEGELSLSLTDLDLPLGSQILKAGSGSGHLDITNLNLKPDGILAKLIQLSGVLVRTSTKVSFSGADFAIQDGKITYDNFAITFGKDFDLRFRGSVGFDDALEMWVSVPVGGALLKGFGVTGPLDVYAKHLAKERVRMEIPIRGTRLSPVLGEVNVGTVLEKITTGLLRQGVQITGDVITLPLELLKRPDSLLKMPGTVIKKSTDVIRTPVDLITKPKETLSDPGALFDRLNVTPQGIVIESLLDVIKKQQETSPADAQPKK
jgi:hypothetical protein